MEQRTEEWFAARCGKVTASRVADVIAKTKIGPSTSRANYKAQLICERLTGKVEEGYSNAAMQWGTEKEPEARSAYSFMTDNDIEEIGFMIHPRILDSGASPDGLVGDKGMLEIKCPITATHIDTLLTGQVPKKYITQMQWQMACSDRDWCDYVSYDPRMPEPMRLFIKRVSRDYDFIRETELEVENFIGELLEDVGDLRRRFGDAN